MSACDTRPLAEVSLDSHPGPWSEADLLALSGPLHHIELIDGSLWVTPRPNRRRNDIAAALLTALRPGAQSTGVRVRLAAGLRLSRGRIVCPDLVIERDSGDLDFGDPAGVLLAGEVTGPGVTAFDRGFKTQLYAEAGIPWFLLAEPDLADYRAVTLHLFQLRGKQYSPVAAAAPGEILTFDSPVPMSLDTGFLIDF
ncbi:Uma2 family endonuclease [Actinoplanes utahensis]|uniref:Putative restriction endonuclease domain-containing protein n=1 Tax=Actinoplanes utahensis TaxID=1869 RepID=A0A0A6UUP5_ACTUT|nr:Uma2 family endonuclease [Actinoplanes utahensis]KHD78678.1 hypothetical protein MB27_03320 [Actinoplanes utahensis]GIF32016.1 hypothetical protein Aut01nite_50020 [Actinoplanes utahensis]